MNILEHTVTSVDTIQSLAALYFGDASRWRDIVDFNNLDYPYITTDPDFQNLLYASGDVSVVRTYTSADLPVPKGTTFAVPPTDGYPSRLYASTQDVTIPAGVSVATIPVQCVIPGLWGDITEGAISTIITDDPRLKSAFSAIANLNPFSNGDTLNVKSIGDSILIPVDDTWNGVEAYDDLSSFYDAQFGADLALGPDGDLVFDGYGDIGSVSGIYNLAQAARDCLMTPKLSLVYHPEYGQMIDQYLNGGNPPYAQKMIALAIMETLMMDDRIDHVNVVSIQQVETEVNVVIDIYPIQQGGDAIRVPVSLPNLNIAA